jgi:hypothetical protein
VGIAAGRVLRRWYRAKRLTKQITVQRVERATGRVRYRRCRRRKQLLLHNREPARDQLYQRIQRPDPPSKIHHAVIITAGQTSASHDTPKRRCSTRRYTRTPREFDSGPEP